MSQVIFESKTSDGRNVRVQAGWDEPLQGYHFSIFDLSMPEDDDAGVIWDDLEDCKTSFPKDIEQFPLALEKFGIEPPEGFWDQVKLKKGNVLIHWKKNHWLEEKF